MEPENPNKEVLANIEQNLEHSVIATTENTKAVKQLETPLEAILLKINEVADNTKPAPPILPKEGPMEISMHGIDVITLKGDKGDQGDKGDAFTFADFTPEQITDLKAPGAKGDKGDKGDQGDKGDKGDQGAKGESIKGDQGDKGNPGAKGDKGDKGDQGSPDTAEKIIEKIKGKFSYEDLADWETLKRFIESKKETTKPDGSPISSKTYAVREMEDVSMQGIVAGQVLQWDGTRFIPYTPSSTSGVTQVFGEVIGTASSAAFTLAHTPVVGSVRVYRGGAYQQGGAGNDYTISGANGTLSSVLQSGEILIADYNY